MMMRAWLILPLVLAGCGRSEQGLPADPVQRAATCGVIAAAEARQASGNVEAKLTLEQQGAILHPAMLAGSEGGRFDKTRTAAAVNAMPALGDKVTSGKWQPLVAECRAAFPAPAQVTLPEDVLTAQAGCHDLAAFFTDAMRASEADYIERIRAYDTMRRELDPKLGASLRARGLGGTRGEETRDRAVAELVTLGNPVAVLDACVTRFET
jgi:hypothetical protein